MSEGSQTAQPPVELVIQTAEVKVKQLPYDEGIAGSSKRMFHGDRVPAVVFMGRRFFNHLSKTQKEQALAIIQPENGKAVVKILSTVMIVDGLLTTSTYPAIYSALPLQSDGFTVFSRWADTTFRTANAASFLASIVSICASLFTILVISVHLAYLEKHKLSGPRQLRDWSAAYFYCLYNTCFNLLGFSALCAGLGVTVASARYNAVIGGIVTFVVVFFAIYLMYSTFYISRWLVSTTIYENKDEESVLPLASKSKGTEQDGPDIHVGDRGTSEPVGILKEVFCLFKPAGEPDFDVVFICDDGKYSTSWQQQWTTLDGTECWLDWLPMSYPTVRVLAVKVDLSSPAWRINPLHQWEKAIANVNSLAHPNVDLGCRPYFLVGHSIGGFLAKEFLMHKDRYSSPRCRESCKGVVFYGVVHSGRQRDIVNLFHLYTAIKGSSSYNMKMLAERCFRLNMDYSQQNMYPILNFVPSSQVKRGVKVHGFNLASSELSKEVVLQADPLNVLKLTKMSDENFSVLVDFISLHVPEAHEVPMGMN